MNLELLYRFYCCANRGNITKASEELFISQPALSKNIMELESELNMKLFFRNKNGIILTPFGKEIYNEIRPSIETLLMIKKYANNIIENAQKNINIGGTKFANENFLNNKIYNFLQKNKDYNLKLYEDKNEVLLEKLKEDELDILFTFLKIDDEKYISQEIMSLDDAIFCSAKNNNLKHTVSIKELTTLPLILNSESASLMQNTKVYFAKEKFALKLKYEISSNDLFNELLVNNLAVGITSSKYVQTLLDKNKIYKLNLETPFPSRRINLIYKKQKIDKIKNILKAFNFDNNAR